MAVAGLVWFLRMIADYWTVRVTWLRAAFPLKRLAVARCVSRCSLFCFVCLCYIETKSAVLCFIWCKCCFDPLPLLPTAFRINPNSCVLFTDHSNHLNIRDYIRLFRIFTRSSANKSYGMRRPCKNWCETSKKRLRAILLDHKLILLFIMGGFLVFSFFKVQDTKFYFTFICHVQ